MKKFYVLAYGIPERHLFRLYEQKASNYECTSYRGSTRKYLSHKGCNALSPFFPFFFLKLQIMEAFRSIISSYESKNKNFPLNFTSFQHFSSIFRDFFRQASNEMTKGNFKSVERKHFLSYRNSNYGGSTVFVINNYSITAFIFAFQKILNPG